MEDVQMASDKRRELEGRVALVTGAGGAACGSAISRRLASEGANIIALDNHERRARDVAASIASEFGVKAVACVADISDRRVLDRALSAATEAIGPVDILVNNAAINIQGSIFDFSPDDFDHVLAVDLNACWYLIRQTIGKMRERGWGSIVNISSVAGYLGGAGREAPYGIAKAGLHDLTRGIALEGGPHNIRCNAIALGLVDSRFVQKYIEQFKGQIERVPLRRLATPQEVAEVVLFLVSERSSYITGEIINVSGGYMLGQ
jgi:NAD(P)-dependent dehydrogenase (short-subunit alcohol dehydrogenase family)